VGVARIFPGIVLSLAPAIAFAQAGQNGLRALDLFAGGVGVQQHDFSETSDPEPAVMAWGWEAGASARFRTWLGLSGAGGVQVFDGQSAWHLIAGPQVMTPIDVSRYYGSRLFAHTLLGYARTIDAAAGAGGAELVIGGGVDIFVFLRLQVDYVRPFVDGLPANNVRGFVGGVVPLCLSECRNGEGLKLARVNRGTASR
jgi:hypothetical protein